MAVLQLSMCMLINMCRAELNCRGCRQRLVGRVINSLEQEGILLAHACVRWTTITWAFQIWLREIENSREVTVLLKAISLLFWIPYFHTKNVLYDKNRTFSTRVFSCRFFSSRFCWTFKNFKRLNAKNHCSCTSLIFTGKAMHFYGLISKLMVLLIKEETHRSNVQLL